jgi:hypothetical protein
MGASKKHRAAEEFRIAQAWYAQAMMHRRKARFDRHAAPLAASRSRTKARECIDYTRYHLAQCGALLGLNGWPK